MTQLITVEDQAAELTVNGIGIAEERIERQGAADDALDERAAGGRHDRGA